VAKGIEFRHGEGKANTTKFFFESSLEDLLLGNFLVGAIQGGIDGRLRHTLELELTPDAIRAQSSMTNQEGSVLEGKLVVVEKAELAEFGDSFVDRRLVAKLPAQGPP
jgi:hypothetical protein